MNIIFIVNKVNPSRSNIKTRKRRKYLKKKNVYILNLSILISLLQILPNQNQKNKSKEPIFLWTHFRWLYFSQKW